MDEAERMAKISNLTVEELRDFMTWLLRTPTRANLRAFDLFEEYERLITSVPEWHEHKGTKCPLGIDVIHRRRYRDGESRDVTTGKNAGDYHWDWKDKGENNADILGYQVFENRRHWRFIKALEEAERSY